MFRGSNRSGPLLPHGNGLGGGGGGGGLYGAARMTPKPSYSKSFIATMIWGLLSLSMIGAGWLYCSRRMESTSVNCDGKICKVEQLKAGVLTRSIIPRADMVRADMVRLKNGEVVDPARLRRSAQRKLGHTYSLVYMEPDSEDDDDESYDSFADDDDSFDSYEDEEDSSEDDDPPVQRSSTKKPGVGTGATKSVPSQEGKKAFQKRKEDQRAKWNEEREAKGLPPIREPDEKAKRAAQMMFEEEEDDERFPGDAGTMKERNSEEIRKMAADQGMTAAQHIARGREAYERAARTHQVNHQRDMQMKQMGNNLHDRSAVGRQRHEDLNPDDLEVDDFERKGGGRSISAVGGLEEVESAQGRRRLSAEEDDKGRDVRGGVDTGGVVSGENDYETLGDLVQAGVGGARRKLLAVKDRVKQERRAPAQRTKKEVDSDASKARETHRQGHGARMKRRRKAANPIDNDDNEDEGSSLEKKREKRKHHHKSFHHKGEVPQEDRHHVHHSYHHRDGDKKVPHGWRHQNRQWHGRKELRTVGTTFSLGRSKARKRKEAINDYVSKQSESVNFTDSKKWRPGGLWLIILGSISAAFCMVIGNFEPRVKSKKVS